LTDPTNCQTLLVQANGELYPLRFDTPASPIVIEETLNRVKEIQRIKDSLGLNSSGTICDAKKSRFMTGYETEMIDKWNKEGLSNAKIAHKLERSTQSVRMYLISKNVKGNKEKALPYSRWTDEEKNSILKLYKSGVKVKEICATLDKSPSVVYRFLRLIDDKHLPRRKTKVMEGKNDTESDSVG
jgi:transposase